LRKQPAFVASGVWRFWSPYGHHFALIQTQSPFQAFQITRSGIPQHLDRHHLVGRYCASLVGDRSGRAEGYGNNKGFEQFPSALSGRFIY
jgi:hypothetical protein